MASICPFIPSTPEARHYLMCKFVKDELGMLSPVLHLPESSAIIGHTRRNRKPHQLYRLLQISIYLTRTPCLPRQPKNSTTVNPAVPLGILNLPNHHPSPAQSCQTFGWFPLCPHRILLGAPNLVLSPWPELANGPREENCW